MNKLSVFIISCISSLSILLLERLAGIKWDYHPDADTYVNSYDFAFEIITNGKIESFFNNFYYVISFMLHGDITLLISINIIAYSLTNVIFFYSFCNFEKKHKIKSSHRFLFFLWIFIFPYRLHLSVQVLKDTLIILSFAILTSKMKFKNIAWLPIFLLRMFSGFYIIPLLSKRYLILFTFIFLAILIVFTDEIFNFLIDKNEVSMTFRDYDIIPTFSQLGLLGVILRGLIWPLFLLSGIYALISPSFAFIPVALGTYFTIFWSKKILNVWPWSLGIYLSLAIIGTVVNGFTSFIRYTFPILVVIPHLILHYEKILFKEKLINIKKSNT